MLQRSLNACAPQVCSTARVMHGPRLSRPAMCSQHRLDMCVLALAVPAAQRRTHLAVSQRAKAAGNALVRPQRYSQLSRHVNHSAVPRPVVPSQAQASRLCLMAAPDLQTTS
jgi:hypothetical protein